MRRARKGPAAPSSGAAAPGAPPVGAAAPRVPRGGVHGSRTPRLGTPLPQAFFARAALELAPDLLGLVLVHHSDEGIAAGRIVEVEAYCGPDDLAAHSAGGRRTARNEVMYGPAGRAYVYFIYGMHWCVNVVAAAPDVPEAVLIRALEPIDGLHLMRARRGEHVASAALARGPGNLTRALGIDRRLNGADLRRGPLRVLRPPGDDGAPASSEVVRSPRIGVDYAGEWAARPWRFSVRDHASVSRPPRRA